uniref:Phosphate:H symporter (Phosphate:H symporter, variant) n=1 Tax=Ganoderma boninense TaxID=34458 RepID=A0A5K1K263_9APHY|nr:Phosphate:H symporter (Phosphate:H symporter, variant) [Ganoderma boninense]
MTKETDRAVAKAYIAIAGLPDQAEEYGDIKAYEKGKEDDKGLRKRRGHSGESDAAGQGSTSLEDRAMDQYFDDGDWESRERTEGRKVAIPSFPLAGPSRVVEKMAAGEQKPWWRWRN